MSQLPVFLLTGFLGAGKTTLLNRLVSGRRDTALVINEFGLVPVDHHLVRQGRERPVVTTTGCICCSAGSDLRGSLNELLHGRASGALPEFSRVIVETTGLADPAPIINSLIPGGLPAMGLRDHAVARAFRLSSVIAVADVQGIGAALDAHPEALRQIAMADHLVLSHTDLAPPGDWPARLAAINPGLNIHDVATLDPTFLLAPGSYSALGKGRDATRWLHAETPRHAPDLAALNRHGAVEALVLTGGPPRDRAAWQALIGDLACQPGLLRIKGMLRDGSDPARPLIAHAVGHRAYPLVQAPDWPDDSPETRLVVIGAHLKAEALRRRFLARF
ncbi:MAG: GTP-binding protein [Paracoccus sp. (in: a-proteobacteria)]|uniref:CobW family GTP-binding protein n=1 Tax=Paracoccus sp. TaxID=267 RepID=UPI0039E70058